MKDFIHRRQVRLMSDSFLCAASERWADAQVLLSRRPIPSDNCLAALELHEPIVELGAGAGVWCALLRQRGLADCVCYDTSPPIHTHTEVWPGSVEKATEHSDHTLLLVHGAQDLDPAAAVKTYIDGGGQTVAYAGELEGSMIAVILLMTCELHVTVSLPGDAAGALTFWRRKPAAEPSGGLGSSCGVLDVKLELADLEDVPDWAQPPAPSEGEKMFKPEIGGRTVRRVG